MFCAATEINVGDLARDNHIIIPFSSSVSNSCSDSKRFVIAVRALWGRFFWFVCLNHDNRDIVRYAIGPVEETQNFGE
jgi:hypothetical protein